MKFSIFYATIAATAHSISVVAESESQEPFEMLAAQLAASEMSDDPYKFLAHAYDQDDMPRN